MTSNPRKSEKENSFGMTSQNLRGCFSAPRLFCHLGRSVFLGSFATLLAFFFHFHTSVGAAPVNLEWKVGTFPANLLEIRPARSYRFVSPLEGDPILPGAMIVLKTRYREALASSAFFTTASRSLEVFPGGIVVVDEGEASLRLLKGRVRLRNEDEKGYLAIRIRDRLLTLEKGEALLEMNPEGDVVCAVPKGAGWVKDLERNIRTMTAGKQLDCPAYGPLGEVGEIDERWKSPPGSPPPARLPKKGPDEEDADENASDSEELASDTEEVASFPEELASETEGVATSPGDLPSGSEGVSSPTIVLFSDSGPLAVASGENRISSETETASAPTPRTNPGKTRGGTVSRETTSSPAATELPPALISSGVSGLSSPPTNLPPALPAAVPASAPTGAALPGR